jgi:hypothetical protein
MLERPARLYGWDIGSNYQGQETMLSKHFVEQTAGNGPSDGITEEPGDPGLERAVSLF